MRCPTCGQAVRVESSDEGTAYYVGIEAERLRNAIEEYALWEPGRAGHAEAHRKLLAAAREES